MKNSQILSYITRILYPFILLFGFYVVLNGHISPGGGFQGGTIIATAVFIKYFFYHDKISNFNLLMDIEKYSFLVIVIMSLLSIVLDTSKHSFDVKRLFLVIMNMIIGLKVTLGLTAIFLSFVEEDLQ